MKRRQKLMTFLINQILFSSEMKKYSSFAEMNMILMTITKAQLLLFWYWEICPKKDCPREIVPDPNPNPNPNSKPGGNLLGDNLPGGNFPVMMFHS